MFKARPLTDDRKVISEDTAEQFCHFHIAGGYLWITTCIIADLSSYGGISLLYTIFEKAKF